jgi:flagellin-like protein
MISILNEYRLMTSSKLTQIASCDERAVSPVIGVILMVAITVILAAVIGAFVLEIGDQQETAPSMSFDSSQKDMTQGGSLNLTAASITHAGGEVFDVDSATTKVEGNESVYRIEGNADQNPPYNPIKVFPTQTISTSQADPYPSEPVSGYPGEQITSGETIVVKAYGKIAPENLYRCMRDKGDPSASGALRVQIGSWFSGSAEMVDYKHTSIAAVGPGTGGSACQVDEVQLLQQDDEINVVWEASSGGKTQTLFKYSVQ